MPSIFSRILRGETHAERLFETEHELAFLDIHPKSAGHTLVIPKLEVASFGDLPAERAASLAATLQTVVKAVTAALGTVHYNLVLNNGDRAGQVVFHVHFHIIPRYAGNSFLGSSPSPSLKETGARIRAALRAMPEASRVPGRIPED